MSFYGYDTARFIPNFSWIAMTGKDLSAIPQAMQVEREINEGRIENDDIYQSLMAISDSIEDDGEFERAFKMPREQFMKFAKPGKSEKPGMYMARAYKLSESGNNYLAAQKGVQQVVDEINTRTTQVSDYQRRLEGIGGQEAIAAEEQQLEGPGMGPPQIEGPTKRELVGDEPKPYTPEEVVSIGQKYGVAGKQLTPQIAEAVKTQYKQQMGTYEPGQTRSEFIVGIGDVPTDPTKEFSKTLPTEKDIMTDERLRLIAQQKANAAAERDKIKRWAVSIRGRKATSDERRRILADQSKNEVNRLKLEIKIKDLQTEIRTKAGKTDPSTFQPLLSPQEEENAWNALESLKRNLTELNEINQDYEGLLRQKGGTETTKNPKKPKKSTTDIKSEFEAWKRGG